jgi:hypothetical protein
MASGVSTTTANEAVSSTNNNVSTLTSAAASASRTQASKAIRPKESKNFGNDELIEKVLPTGNEFLELIS